MFCVFSGQCKVKGITQTITRNIDKQFIDCFVGFSDIDKQFIDCFVGFSEGDGGFYYSNSGGYERLFFKIRQKNRNVLDYIHYYFNLGSLTQLGVV